MNSFKAVKRLFLFTFTTDKVGFWKILLNKIPL